MILGIDLLTTSWTNIKFSKHVIIGRAVPYEGFFSPMVDLNNHQFKTLTYKTNKQ